MKQMERLTEKERNIDGTGIAKEEITDGLLKPFADKILTKLADYEDLEEQGLLVRLPCKVGDDVYIIPSPSIYGLNIINGYEKGNKVYHQHVGTIIITDGYWYATSREEYGVYNEKVLNDIAYGITWFTDYEEAEKKLDEMNGK